MKRSTKKLGKQSVHQDGHTGHDLDTLERMARIKASGGSAGALTIVGRVTALSAITVGGIALAAGFLAPGLALAGSLPSDATGAHPWITDGGGEVATDVAWRLQVTVEYIAAGLGVLYLSLRFGKVWLGKLQDWYEAGPSPAPTAPAESEPEPQISQFPAPLRRPAPRNKNVRRDGGELHPA